MILTMKAAVSWTEKDIRKSVCSTACTILINLLLVVVVVLLPPTPLSLLWHRWISFLIIAVALQ